MTRDDEHGDFHRHLSSDFLQFLTEGAGTRLIDAFKSSGLDVRIRGDYLNAYSVGNSLAKVSRSSAGAPRLSVSRKYLEGVELPNQRKPRVRAVSVEATPPAYVEIELDAASIAAYVASLPTIKKNAEEYAKPEARWEERCVRANAHGCPQVVLDRQIAKGDAPGLLPPGRKRRGAVRLDLLTALAPPNRGLVAVELKRDLDGRIQHVASQLIRYLEFLDPYGDGFSADIAGSYRKACQQSAALGLPAPPAEWIEPGLPVHGLIGLANYNEKSALLGRAMDDARSLPRRVHYCLIEDGAEPELPAVSGWLALN